MAAPRGSWPRSIRSRPSRRGSAGRATTWYGCAPRCAARSSGTAPSTGRSTRFRRPTTGARCHSDRASAATRTGYISRSKKKSWDWSLDDATRVSRRAGTVAAADLHRRAGFAVGAARLERERDRRPRRLHALSRVAHPEGGIPARRGAARRRARRAEQAAWPRVVYGVVLADRPQAGPAGRDL